MSSSQGTVNVDNLGQAAYSGNVAVVTDALSSDKQLAHVADTVGNVVSFALCLRKTYYHCTTRTCTRR